MVVMERFMHLGRAVVLFLAGVGLSSAVFSAGLDRGGMSVDFAACSRARFQEGRPPVNLIPNPDFAPVGEKDIQNWRGDYFIIFDEGFRSKDSQKDPRYEEARRQVVWKVADKVASIEVPESLNRTFSPKVTASFASAWRTVLDLPDDQGGTYSIRFRYRCTHAGAGRNFFILTGMDRAVGRWYTGKDTTFQVCPFNDTPAWGEYRKNLVLPPGTKSVELVFRTDGVGSFEFAEPVWSRVGSPDYPVTLKLAPMGFLDSRFVLARDRIGVVAFVWKRNGSKDEVQFKAPRLRLELPPGVDFLEAPNLKTVSCTKTEQGAATVEVDVAPWQHRLRDLDGFDNWVRISVAVRSGLPAGSSSAGSARIVDGGKPVSNLERILFEVSEPFVARQPRIFLPGLFHGGPYLNFNEDRDLQSYVDMLKETGFTCAINGAPRWTPLLRQAGFRRVLGTENYIANGYRVGSSQDRPEADRYVYHGKTDDWDILNAVCPSAVYEKREHFMTRTVPRLKKDLAGCDGLWANWEPYMFAGRGCFCGTCRRKFAAFLGVDETELAADWPGIALMGGKFHARWVRFRSLEHAKLVRTIDEIVRSATGEDSMGFVPGVQVDDLGPHWRECGFDQENHPIDYAGSLRWIEPWGPYAHWKTENPYVYVKPYSLNVFWTARGVRAAVDRDYPLPNRPKLQAFPHGVQCDEWATTPESLKLDMLSFFFNGWESSVIYYFPRGYDYRYWRAVAESSDLAARYEDYVFNGRRVDDQVALVPCAPYAGATWVSDDLTAVSERLSMLQGVAYAKDDGICVAAFNFWLKGEAFFDLKVSGLEKRRKYHVYNGDRLFAAGIFRDCFTGRELAEKGARVHAGAARCEVFEIVPDGKNPRRAERISPWKLRRFRREGLPALKKAARDDLEYEKMYAPRTSKIADIANAGIVGKADTGRMALDFTAPGVEISLDAGTLNVVRWIVDGQKVIQGDENSGFGAVAFWKPVLQVHSGFVVTEEKKLPDGVAVVGERLLLDRDHHDLQRVLVRTTISITEKGRRIAAETEFVNDSMIVVSLGARYNIMPGILAERKNFLQFASRGATERFHRDLGRNFLCRRDDLLEGALRTLFEVKSPSLALDSAEVLLVSPEIRARARFSPEELFGGLASWDSGRQFAPTMEPCFSIQTLKPGGKFAIRAEIAVDPVRAGNGVR